jgi:hypothetical protein
MNMKSGQGRQSCLLQSRELSCGCVMFNIDASVVSLVSLVASHGACVIYCMEQRYGGN